MTKTHITCEYQEDESPLRKDRLLVSTDGGAWLEPHLYEVVSDTTHPDGSGTLVVAADIPDRVCRFRGEQNGMPFACYGFDAALTGRASYMEDAPDGFAPDLVCLHCAQYAFGRDERHHRITTATDGDGYLMELPELAADEVPEDPHFVYISRETGEVIRP